MPIDLPCLLCKQHPTVSQQYRLVEQLKDESTSFTRLGRTLQAVTSVNIFCVYPTVVCRKCRDVINKSQKLQQAYFAEVNKLKSMLPPSAVCLNAETPVNSPSRPPLPIHVRTNVLKRTLSASTSPTGLTPQPKRLYSQVSHRVARPLLPTLCTPLVTCNVPSEHSTNITQNVQTPTNLTPIKLLLPAPSGDLQTHHPPKTMLQSHAVLTPVQPQPLSPRPVLPQPIIPRPLLPTLPGTGAIQSANPKQPNAPQISSKKPALRVISNLLKAEEPISAQSIPPTQIPTSQAVPLDQNGQIMVQRNFIGVN